MHLVILHTQRCPSCKAVVQSTPGRTLCFCFSVIPWNYYAARCLKHGSNQQSPNPHQRKGKKGLEPLKPALFRNCLGRIHNGHNQNRALSDCDMGQSLDELCHISSRKSDSCFRVSGNLSPSPVRPIPQVGGNPVCFIELYAVDFTEPVDNGVIEHQPPHLIRGAKPIATPQSISRYSSMQTATRSQKAESRSSIISGLLDTISPLALFGRNGRGRFLILC